MFKPFFIFIFFILLSGTVFAAPQKMSIKLVFPFGDKSAVSVCPADKITLEGCCNDTGETVYEFETNKKGCCKTPNTVDTVGGTTRCCKPPSVFCPTGAIWGKSSASVCGKCCDLPKTVLTYGGNDDCCTPCAGGQERMGRSTTDVCGTCCPAAHYADAGVCKPCPLHCLKCQNGTSCDQCDPLYPIWNGAWCVACP